jgi:hypothetical protein
LGDSIDVTYYIDIHRKRIMPRHGHLGVRAEVNYVNAEEAKELA